MHYKGPFIGKPFHGVIHSAAGGINPEDGRYTLVIQLGGKFHTFHLIDLLERVDVGERVRIYTNDKDVESPINICAMEILDKYGKPKFTVASNITDIKL